MDEPDVIVQQPAPGHRRSVWWLSAVLVAVLGAAGAGAAAMLGAFTRPSQPPGLPTAVYLQLDATGEQKANIETYLHTLQIIGDIRFETRDEAYQDFLIMFKDCDAFTKEVRPEYLPESFRFVLAKPDDLPAVQVHLQSEPGFQRIIAPASLTPSPGACRSPDRQ